MVAPAAMTTALTRRQGDGKQKFCQPLCRRQRKTNLGATIRIGQEIWCLPYAGFLLRHGWVSKESRKEKDFFSDFLYHTFFFEYFYAFYNTGKSEMKISLTLPFQHCTVK